MAGRQISSMASSRSKSPLLLFTLSLLTFAILFFLVSISSVHPPLPSPDLRRNTAAGPETSFVASLERFLASAPPRSAPARDDTVAEATELDVKRIDDSMFGKERERLLEEPYFPSSLPIRVYVYEMPRKFTYDLLWLFSDTYKQTFNLTSNGSPVHRLIEQHSIDYWLWADLIAPESKRLLKSVIRVHQQEEADLFYIPFFTTISFFLMEKQECKALYREALKWVTDQPAWKRSEGRDHILPVHHPWSFKSVRKFMKHAIWLLPDMDSTGNWYKPGQVSLEKDLILPYVANVDLCDAKCLSETQHKRETLLFFRGRLKRNAVSTDEMQNFEEIKLFLGDSENPEAEVIPPFELLTKKAVESLRYRAEDIAKSVTKIAVRESRAQDLRNEILNSEKLKAHFAVNPRDLDLLKHDKNLSKNPAAPHLRDVPDYLQDATTQEASKMVRLARAAMGGNNKNPRRQGPRRRSNNKDKDPIKSMPTEGSKRGHRGGMKRGGKDGNDSRKRRKSD